MDLEEEILTSYEEALALRRELHQNPELSLKEYKTAAFIASKLDSFGIKHRRVFDTSVVGEIKGKGEGNTILLRADIDALPIQENTSLDYSSKVDGVMHACGHDMHTAILLTAAKILSKHRDSFNGNVRLVFQAGEEIGRGARELVGDGVLSEVSRVFGLHVAPDIPYGSVGIKKGPNNASVDAFTIKEEGKEAHVATPEKGVDAIFILSQIIVNLQSLIARCTSPLEPKIVGVGKIKGGSSYNIIASTAEAEGTLRAATNESRSTLKKKIDLIVKETANQFGGAATVNWKDYASPLINSSLVCDELIELIHTMCPDITIVTDRPFSLTGDNFSDFIESVDGAYLYLGTASDECKNSKSPYHTPTFSPDERALLNGVRIEVLYVLSYLNALIS